MSTERSKENSERIWGEVEGRQFIFPPSETALSSEQVEGILRGKIESVAKASQNWWIRSNFGGELLGGVDYIHPVRMRGDVGITSPDFLTALKKLMDEYGASNQPLLVRESGQIEGMEGIESVFEERMYPTRMSGLAFFSDTQLELGTGKIKHIWWRIQVIVPGTIISEEERQRIGKKIIRSKPDGEPTAFWEATGDWWNNAGLAKVGSEVVRRFLDEFSPKTEEEKEQLLAQFEGKIKQPVYPSVVVVNEDLRLLFEEHTSLKGLPGAAIYQDKETGQPEAFDLKAPRGERVRRVSHPLEINNRPQLTILLGKGLDDKTVSEIDDLIQRVRGEIIGLENKKLGPLRILGFEKTLFHQGRGSIELEIPIL